MTARRFQKHRFRYFLIGFLLICISGTAGVLAQVSVPAPNHGQVIAQGVLAIDSGEYFWSLEQSVASRPEQISSSNLVSGAFIYATEIPLILHQDYGDFVLLSEGQAAWAGMDVPVQIEPTEVPADFSLYSLQPEQEIPTGANPELFAIEDGFYNLQMTKGVVDPGETESFSPANDIPWLLVVIEGELEIPKASLKQGDDLVYYGDIEMTATADSHATYLAIAVGERVELPTGPTTVIPDSLIPEKETGTLTITQSECLESDFTQCDLAAEEFDVMFTHENGNDITFLSLDGEWVSEGTFALELPPGTYYIDIPMPGAWTYEYVSWVDIAAGSETSLQIARAPNEAVGTLIVTEVECPYYGATDCTYGAWTWDIWLTNADTGDTFDLMGYGYEYAEGQWEMTLPAGSYFVSIGFADGYQYEFPGIVDVPAQGVADLQVNRDPVAEDLGTGTAIISMFDCTTSDGSMCPLSEMDWEVILTNADTGEEFVMTQVGTSTVAGQWYIQLPAGGYTVQAMALGPWTLEYPTWVDVPANGSAYIEVYGFPVSQSAPTDIHRQAYSGN